MVYMLNPLVSIVEFLHLAILSQLFKFHFMGTSLGYEEVSVVPLADES